MQPSNRSIGFALAAVCLVASAPLATAQCETAKLTASDGAGSDDFGWALDLEGERAVVGAWGDDDDGFGSGSAYVFEHGPLGWQEVAKLTASDASGGDRFGWSVAIDGDRLVVGAYLATVSWMPDAGKAYVFERNGSGVWKETAVLEASDAEEDAKFGSSVSISGDRVLVGAELDDGAGPLAGAAYVFHKSLGHWVEEAKLTAGDAAGGDVFGRSVALQGDRALVGAELHDHGAGAAGAAYVFERGPGGWTQTAELLASDAAVDDLFAVSLDLDGDTIVVGAGEDDDLGTNSGSAYVFERSTTGWSQTAELHASDASPYHGFGGAVGLGGDTIAVGAPNASTTGHQTGAAYLFRRAGADWRQAAQLESKDGVLHDFFGDAIAFDGERALVGAKGDDGFGNHTGAAYVFQLPGEVTPYGFCALGPCNNSDSTAGCVNSTGRGARLAACGSTSVAADDLVLDTASLPPGTGAVLLRGGATAYAPFGDGLRVVGPGAAGLYRYAAVTVAPDGSLRLGPGLVGGSVALSGGPIAAGETWTFQLAFVDPSGPCASAVNLSNGLAITFVP